MSLEAEKVEDKKQDHYGKKKMERTKVVKKLCYPAGILKDEYMLSDNKNTFFRVLSFCTRYAKALGVAWSAVTNGLSSISPS